MTSAKSYARAYLDASESLPVNERVAWLMVLNDRKVQRTLARLLQQADAGVQLSALGIPEPVANFLKVVSADRAVRRLGSIAKQGMILAFEQGIASPVLVQTARDMKDQQLDLVERMLTERLPTPVIIETRTDPSLLGGLRLTIGGRQTDRSARGALSALATQLQR